MKGVKKITVGGRSSVMPSRLAEVNFNYDEFDAKQLELIKRFLA